MKPAIANDYSQALDRVLAAWEQQQVDIHRFDRLVRVAALRNMSIDELKQVLERIDRGYRLLHPSQRPTRAQIVDLALEHIDSH